MPPLLEQIPAPIRTRGRLPILAAAAVQQAAIRPLLAAQAAAAVVVKVHLVPFATSSMELNGRY